MTLKNNSKTNGQNANHFFGMSKGKLQYPDDIDFCNNEIAEMFNCKAEENITLSENNTPCADYNEKTVEIV